MSITNPKWVLKAKRELAKKRLSKTVSNPNKKTFDEKEERDFIRANKPSCNKLVQIYTGKLMHNDINHIVLSFRKCGFDYSKFDKDYTKKIDSMNTIMTALWEKDQESYENTIVEVFIKSYKLLNDKKFISKISEMDKEFNKEFGKNINEWRRFEQEKQFVFMTYLSIIVMFIIMMSYLILATTTIFMFQAKELDPLYNSEEYFIDIDKFERTYFSFTKNMSNVVIMFADWFEYADINKIFTELKTKSKNKYSNEGYSEEELKIIDKSAYSEEELVLAISIILGVALFVIGFFPMLRSILYYIESMKVDISNEYKDQAEYLETNIGMLEKKMEATDDKIEKERLSKIIEKQKVYYERFRTKQKKWFNDTEVAEDIAESRYEEDLNVYDTEDDPDVYL